MTRKVPTAPFGDDRVAVERKKVPFDFVLEALEPLEVSTKPMFGCTAVYVGEKIVLILRQKDGEAQDNGVWLATTPEHHASLRKEFAHMRSISVFGPGVTGWQVLPEAADDFEDAALRACERVKAGDPRIGKVPNSRKPKAPRTAKASAVKKAPATKKATAAVKKKPMKKAGAKK